MTITLTKDIFLSGTQVPANSVLDLSADIEASLVTSNAATPVGLPPGVTQVGDTLSAAMCSVDEKTAVIGDDFLPLLDSENSNALKRTSITNIASSISAEIVQGAALLSGSGSEQAYKLNASDTIGASCNTTLLMTTAYYTHKSTIGGQVRPAGTVGSNSDPNAPANTLRGVPWENDTTYVAGTADVSIIVGGYDHVCNQIAGTIVGGGHNFIPYNAGGHSTIVGGSNHKLSGSYGLIAGGVNNTIGVSSQAAIVGGENNFTASICSGIVGGSNIEIGTDNAYSGVLGGRYSVVGTGGGYNAIISGQSNTIQDIHKYVVLLGRDAKSEVTGSLTQGRTKLVNLGDCQSSIITYGVRTTSASAANLSSSEGYQWALGSTACAVAVSCLLVGVDEATGNAASYTYTGLVKWDGSSVASVSDAGGSGTTRQFTQVVDGIGVSALPVLSVSAGQIRPQASGKSATNIKWCCTVNAAAVRV